MSATATAAPVNEDRSFFGHPRGLATLFFTEMWERFSYYGLRAILVFFLSASVANGGLGMDKPLASSVVSVYGAAIYMSALAGGWIADRLLGSQRSVFYGGLVIMFGHVCMALPFGSSTVWLGLALIIVGTSLLKPNISSVVGSLYSKTDARRDAGFSVFYTSINIGSFVGQLVTGYLGEKVNWHVGFGAAAVGMAIGLIQYKLGARHLGNAAAAPSNPLTPEERGKAFTRIGMAVAGVAVVLVIMQLTGTLDAHGITNAISIAAMVLPVIYFAVMLRSPKTTKIERDRVKAYIPLFIAATLFWLIFEQAANVLNIYADERVEKTVFGWEFPASWFQSVNPMFLVLFSPIVAMIWLKLGQRQPSTPRKFAIAVASVGLSFGVLALAAMLTGPDARVSPLWLLLVYAIQTVAELLLSPVGLSMTTKLAPAAFLSQMMGMWFLATSAGYGLAAQIVPFYSAENEIPYFGILAICAVALAVLLWIGTNRVRKLMHGVS
ncbi:proton-dependent oligopeptide transporter, POT family [Streptoalloteichus tenebrarius]|uniref:Proton-dependent oligopeptide transporter, POT family n=1 Tax=Streptoalloteichus tenebrarius (strain ATCC 17920 / DSM 40477 / JCM 4838 / CBS 697.72 / NBRC 16177 / NCIMB 11028 / NRRL B-12390 / A12253. 1 / ISP 5477) TaxID=1933 RepID=A0ABT1HQT6_STRSD|nr:peptide MFS transporter [Streptoalloteichus tenebrarius]MCP2257869.1 proton-dependent oligopeptide transporter, POT family [Streptoalloteichus tenebrarius]BFE99768.1 peptide MFS transporter [Streptoalloteichus tenebrarius]